MGQVYRAEDSTLGREVAIKVLPETVSAEPERLARFDREARVRTLRDLRGSDRYR
jgi:serine/threonine protein kinase